MPLLYCRDTKLIMFPLFKYSKKRKPALRVAKLKMIRMCPYVHRVNTNLLQKYAIYKEKFGKYVLSDGDSLLSREGSSFFI